MVGKINIWTVYVISKLFYEERGLVLKSLVVHLRFATIIKHIQQMISLEKFAATE